MLSMAILIMSRSSQKAQFISEASFELVLNLNGNYGANWGIYGTSSLEDPGQDLLTIFLSILFNYLP